jgi:hypothetical protein
VSRDRVDLWIATPSRKLRAHIEASGDGPLIARDVVPGKTRVLRWSGTELSADEARRILALGAKVLA